MVIEYLPKEQDWKNETTRYWFDVDGDQYCIADTNGDLSLLDEDGHPIEDCNDHDGVKRALLPHYEKRISE